jgi:predicted nucleic acid-binding protein
VVTPAVQLDIIKEDPADDRILECAVTGGSNYIVAGDKDLLRLGQFSQRRARLVNFARHGNVFTIFIDIIVIWFYKYLC